MSSVDKADDCYYFFYSTCIKGDSCQFRHCDAALGTEEVCDLWRRGNCTRKLCAFRHSDTSAGRQRSMISCYWESQPGGCQKPHCPYNHKNPKPVSTYTERLKLAQKKKEENFQKLKIKGLDDLKLEKGRAHLQNISLPNTQSPSQAWIHPSTPSPKSLKSPISPVLVLPKGVLHTGSAGFSKGISPNPYKFVAGQQPQSTPVSKAVQEQSERGTHTQEEISLDSTPSVTPGYPIESESRIPASRPSVENKDTSAVKRSTNEGKKDIKIKLSGAPVSSSSSRESIKLSVPMVTHKVVKLPSSRWEPSENTLSSVKVKTLEEIKQERKRKQLSASSAGGAQKKTSHDKIAETKDVSMPFSFVTDKATGQSCEGNQEEPLKVSASARVTQTRVTQQEKKVDLSQEPTAGSQAISNASKYEPTVSKVKSDISKQETTGSKVKSDTSKQGTTGSKVKSDTSKQGATGSKVKSDTSKQGATGSKVKSDTSKQGATGSKVKSDTSKQGATGSKVKSDTSKQGATGSKVKRGPVDPSSISSSGKRFKPVQVTAPVDTSALAVTASERNSDTAASGNLPHCQDLKKVHSDPAKEVSTQPKHTSSGKPARRVRIRKPTRSESSLEPQTEKKLMESLNEMLDKNASAKLSGEEDYSLLNVLEGEDEDLFEAHSDSRDDDDVLLEIEEMIRR